MKWEEACQQREAQKDEGNETWEEVPEEPNEKWEEVHQGNLETREEWRAEVHQRLGQARQWGEDLRRKGEAALQLAKVANLQVLEALQQEEEAHCKWEEAHGRWTHACQWGQEILQKAQTEREEDTLQ